MSHFSVNSLRPILFYALLLALLMAFGYAMHQGRAVFPYEINFPYQKRVSLGLFGFGALFGVFAMLKNIKRSEKPWAVPRAHINCLFILFLVSTISAIVLAK